MSALHVQLFRKLLEAWNGFFLPSVADERVLGVEFTDDALSVSLRDGRIITVPLVWFPCLLNATPAQRQNWKIASGGYGLHWPDLDEDLSTEGLLRGAPAPKAHIPSRNNPARVERTLLSAAFEVGVGADFCLPQESRPARITTNPNPNSSGQECPLYTFNCSAR